MIIRVLLPHRDLTPRASAQPRARLHIRRGVEPLLKAVFGWAAPCSGRHMEIGESLAWKIPTSILEAKKSLEPGKQA
jgi:hypothetical protein